MAADTTFVLDAVRAGDLDSLEQASDEQLLEAARLRSLLHEATRHDQHHVLPWLFDKGKQLGDALLGGWHAVHLHAAMGDLQALTRATFEELERKTDVKESVLHVAASAGQVAVVEYLVQERDFDVDARGLGLVTPLHLAADAGRTHVMEKLVELGIDVGARDAYDLTALFGAFEAHTRETINCLLRLGADPHAVDQDGETALHQAARLGGVDAVEVLVVSGGVDVNVRSDAGASPLHVAPLGGVDVVTMLLVLGADVDALDGCGQTVLHRACAERVQHVEEVVRLLLEAGADRSIEDQDGETARGMALAMGSDSVVDVLNSYWPVPLSMVQLLLGMKGPTESPLVRFSSHELFEPRVLALIKCLLTGEDKGAFSQLVEEAERS